MTVLSEKEELERELFIRWKLSCLLEALTSLGAYVIGSSERGEAREMSVHQIKLEGDTSCTT